MSKIRGFTLLEMLFALALWTVALGLILATSTRSSQQVTQAQAQTAASIVASNVLEDVGYGIALVPGTYQGLSVDQRFRWQLTIVPYRAEQQAALASNAHTLYSLHVTVLWGKQRLQWHSLRTGGSAVAHTP